MPDLTLDGAAIRLLAAQLQAGDCATGLIPHTSLSWESYHLLPRGYKKLQHNQKGL